MKMKVITGITLTLFLASALCVVFNVVPVTAGPEIIRVPDDYERVQGAVGNASAGDTILVGAGTYYEHVTIDKNNLTLIGENHSTTFIDGNETGTVVDIKAHNVSVSGFTIQSGRFGVYLTASSGCDISGNTVTNNWGGGVMLYFSSDNNTISDNNISNNRVGIDLWESCGNTIGGNTLLNNRDDGIWLDFSSGNNINSNTISNHTRFGIVLDSSGGNVLRDNNMTANRFNFVVTYAGSFTSLSDYIQDIDTSNTVDGKPMYYLINQKNLLIEPSTFPDIGYLALINSMNVTMRDLTLTKNSEGVLLVHTNSSTIDNVKASNNEQGIHLVNSNNNTIIANKLSNNHCGIKLYKSSNNTVSGNTVLNNGVGINVYWYCGNNMIMDNTMSNNGDGIILESSSDHNTISSNTISNNEDRGILIDHCRGGNIINGNFISNNSDGISIAGSNGNMISGNTVLSSRQYGILLYYASQSNLIYHNNIIDNSRQAVDEGEYFHNNTWDDGYPSGGNYWSDYKGVDNYSGPHQNETGSDGIGDTPYVIDAHNQDNYPLMTPWTQLPLRVHNIDTGLDYATIQEAIDAPKTLDGHTILVDAGTYYEQLTVDKSLTLQGENRGTTIIDGNGTGTVIHVNADNVSVTGFTIRGSGSASCGIYMDYSNGNNISHNIITNNGYAGIRLDNSEDNTISNNKVSNNDFIGVYVFWYSKNNVISNNTISNNDIGIEIGVSSSNAISANTISNNLDGIILHGSSNNNVIFNNSISLNTRESIECRWGPMPNDYPSNNVISSNTLSNNNVGIYMDGCFNNTVYHNNFIKKPWYPQVSSEESVNTWDNGAEGNFWSDYTGVDADGDGIGDTPYVIDANNTDRYPLIVPLVWNYSNPIPIVWEEAIYPIALSSNSTISMFKFNQPQMQISFDVTGPSGTIGFCNVTIPKSLLKDSPWAVTIDGQPPIDFIPTDNATHSFLYFTYTHASTRHIVIEGTWVVPEFPSAIILPLFLILTLITLILAKKKTLQRKRHFAIQ